MPFSHDIRLFLWFLLTLTRLLKDDHFFQWTFPKQGGRKQGTKQYAIVEDYYKKKLISP